MGRIKSLSGFVNVVLEQRLRKTKRRKTSQMSNRSSVSRRGQIQRPFSFSLPSFKFENMDLHKSLFRRTFKKTFSPSHIFQRALLSTSQISDTQYQVKQSPSSSIDEAVLSSLKSLSAPGSEKVNRIANPGSWVYNTEIPEGTPPITRGQSRFAVANDGEQDCLALLINQRMLDLLSEIAVKNRALRQLEIVQWEAHMAVNQTNRSVELQEALQRQEEATRTLEDIRKRYPETLEACRRQRSLAKEAEILKGNIGYAKNQSQYLFEEALRGAQLLVKTPDPSKPVQTPSTPTTSANCDGLAVSSENLFRQAALKKYEKAMLNLHEAQEQFDDRVYQNWSQKEEWKRLVADGEVSISGTEFGIHMFLYNQGLTRQLIDAEQAARETGSHAKALNVHPEQESDLECNEDEENRKIQEVDCVTCVDRDWIESWRAAIPDRRELAVSPDEAAGVDGDQWDARTVELAESFSIVASDRYRDQIDQWRDYLGANREAWQPNRQ